MRILRVGDPHVKVSNLDESERLLGFILAEAHRLNVDTIELLGDLFHTHAIVRLEVLEFWRKWLWKLSESFITIVLVGNHDQSGDHGSSQHALSVFTSLNPDRLLIIERAALIKGIGYLPYIHDNAKFVEEANALAELGATFLVSHTTYEGSKYDNGMYAPSGVNPDDLSSAFTGLLSGHVHTEQTYGRVIYPGTARWDTASDANKRKGIWFYVHADAGNELSREFISTETVCVPLYAIEWREGDPEPTIAEGARVSVELVGTSNWISQAKAALKGKCSIRTNITDSKKAENRRATLNLEDYLQNLFVSTMDKEHLLKYAKELGLV